MPYHLTTPLFPSGELLVSASVLSRGFEFLPLLHRHLAGDWGQISDYDRDCNIRSLADGAAVLSQFTVPDAGDFEDLISIVTAAKGTHTVIFIAEESHK